MPWPDFSNGKQLVVLLRAVLVLSAICILSTFYFLHEPAKASTASLLETDPQCQIREVVKYVYIERRSASTNNSSASQNSSSSSSSTSETVLLDDRTPKRDVLPYDFPLPKNNKPYTRGEGSRMRFFQPIPVGEGHNAHGEERYPLWGSDHVDESTTLLEAQDGGRESNDPYDRPEDADALAVQGSIWHELITNFRNADIARLTADNSSALCLIASVYSGNCRYLDESFEQCVRRVGADSLDKVLPEKCRWGQYWKHIRDLTGSGSSQTPVLFGAVPQAELCSAGGPPSFVEPSRRDIAPFGPPRHCRNGALEYPIAFGTPRANVQKKLLPKLFDFHPVPLDAGPKPFSFNDEENYQALAAMSHFCMTHSRGGWDCGRHYEVMGAGCVPYFYDIKAAGPYILPQLPKKLLMDIVSMPLFAHIGHAAGANGDHYDLPDSPYIKRDSFNGRTRVRFVKEGFRFKEGVQLDKAWYWRTARKLLRYTQKYLTSEAMAAYVLKTMGAEDAKHVLILTRSAWDNLHQSFIAGLDALGVKMTIFATNNDRKLFGCFQSGAGGKALTSANLCERRGQAGRPGVHGNGVPWANRMQNADAIEYVNDWHVLNDRADKGFDAAIYTYYLEEGYPYGLFANVRENTNGKVAILDHDDSMGDPRRNGIYMAKEAYFFSRELRKTFC